MADSPVQTMNLALEQMIPRAHQMGVTFLELRPGYVRAEVPFEGNGNHFGVIYAGVLFTLAEVLGGAMHMISFDAAATHYPLIKGMRIDFLAPGKGRLSATATLTDEQVAEIKAAAANGKVSYELRAEILDTDGKVVVTTVGDYQIRPYGT